MLNVDRERADTNQGLFPKNQLVVLKIEIPVPGQGRNRRRRFGVVEESPDASLTKFG
jgi:hypothetical protein